MTGPGISTVIKKISGFATRRSMPTLYRTTLKKWHRRWTAQQPQGHAAAQQKTVYLFCDEFTNYNDVEIGVKAIRLLDRLGYSVVIPDHLESGRTWLSKGLLRKAKRIANENISLLAPLITDETPLIGLEPSAILSFRDEYIDLADEQNFEASKKLAASVFTFEEFLAREVEQGRVRADQFTTERRSISLHGHCQQKAVSSLLPSVKILSLPANYSVEVIPSGCCGMAGSFGFEKEHFDISMKIGELVLFPAVRTKAGTSLIAAAGTSCRHQIKDGTAVTSMHPAEILFDALV
jgi:Fe-S oxidoreductase